MTPEGTNQATPAAPTAATPDLRSTTPGWDRAEVQMLRDALEVRRNILTPSAYRKLAECLAFRSTKIVYDDWMRHPLTKMFLDAISLMAVRTPPAASISDAATQYGVTQGLALARTLMEDPSEFFANVFMLDESGQMPDETEVTPGPYAPPGSSPEWMDTPEPS